MQAKRPLHPGARRRRRPRRRQHGFPHVEQQRSATPPHQSQDQAHARRSRRGLHQGAARQDHRRLRDLRGRRAPGAGRQLRPMRRLGGDPDALLFRLARPLVECEACLGGGIARQTCPTCNGAGKAIAHSYSIQVRIPHGVRHGDLLGVKKKRARGVRPPADLEIRIEIIPRTPSSNSTTTARIRCEMPVDGFAWITNRLASRCRLDGFKPLRLSRDQLSYRLKGQGFPAERRGARGDQLVAVLAGSSRRSSVPTRRSCSTSSSRHRNPAPDRPEPAAAHDDRPWPGSAAPPHHGCMALSPACGGVMRGTPGTIGFPLSTSASDTSRYRVLQG